MELQLRQGQKMEAIGRLAGGIAHDFNNLLGVISGYGELVSEQIDPASNLRNPVEQIRKAAEPGIRPNPSTSGIQPAAGAGN